MEQRFDYIVVGGGTAGVVMAARLAENPALQVALIEAGPSDSKVAQILELAQWQTLLGSRYDYDYGIEAQPRGNSAIRHSRGKMLGGCSSHNSCIAFLPTAYDLSLWEAQAGALWSAQALQPAIAKLRSKVHLEPSESGNAAIEAFVCAGEQAGFPRSDFLGDFQEAVGWFQLNKRGGLRQSSSVAYLHNAGRLPANLHLLTDTRVLRLEGEREAGELRMRYVLSDAGRLCADQGIILSCGAFDSPKLLKLSGIGAAAELESWDIPVLCDLPGVGENLLDHPEGVMIWHSEQPVPPESSNIYEAGLFARVDADAPWPDLMFHFGTQAFDMHTRPAGYPSSSNAVSLTPNVARAKSRGWVRLRSADPRDPPRIDFRYFSDPEGYDERIMVAGLKLARELAAQAALRPWASRELAPGPQVQSDAELSAYVRRTANTVYHPTSSCRMGQADDPGAVVDPQLRVRGVQGLYIADASVLPSIPSVNPALSCMLLGEHGAALLLARD